MKCEKKRTIFDLFSVYSCRGCQHLALDEEIVIGNSSLVIYHLFDRCPNLSVSIDDLYSNSKKLKLLFKDAIINQDRIWFLFIEDFRLSFYYDCLSLLLDSGMSVHIVTE